MGQSDQGLPAPAAHLGILVFPSLAAGLINWYAIDVCAKRDIRARATVFDHAVNAE